MTTIRAGIRVAGLLLLGLTGGGCAGGEDTAVAADATHAAGAAGAGGAGFLYGRVTAADGEVYEGRLRFGQDEEALWGNYFNGFRDENPWLAHAPREEMARDRLAWELFGIEFAVSKQEDLGRPFMARFGDIARIDARGRDLTVTLKSGSVHHLDRYAADDFADGVRVWDGARGAVDLAERKVRSIEFFPARGEAEGPRPLFGTVRTRGGDFTGLLQWEREAALDIDALAGEGPEGEVSLRFDAIRSIERRSGPAAVVTLTDGRTVPLSRTRADRQSNRGLYVDDPRYGRVLISWEAFDRVDFAPAAAAPTYEAFAPGEPLRGSVTTRSGRVLAGRLVYDLDESEITETLDAPRDGVDYTIRLGLIESVEPLAGDAGEGARVRLRSGEELWLDRAGDLGEGNAGVLIFPTGSTGAEYVPWRDVARLDFVPPAAAAGQSTPH